MSYTREQAEEMIKDWNKFHGCSKEFNSSDTEFLNHKFCQQLEVGKWYKNDKRDSKLCYLGRSDGFGTWEGMWDGNWGINPAEWQPMTNEEVHDFLKSECEKRYKVGDVVKSVFSNREWKIYSSHISIDENHLAIDETAILDLSTGKWAEVIKKDPIAEQIEKLEKELETLKKQIK
jgi:hypothetical protein